MNYTDPNGQDPWWCDTQPNPTECWESYGGGRAGYSYTELVYQSTGWREHGFMQWEKDGSFRTGGAIDDPQWFKAHVSEWNGDWGTMDTIYGPEPYLPAMGEFAAMQRAHQEAFGTDISCDALGEQYAFIFSMMFLASTQESNPAGNLEGALRSGKVVAPDTGEILYRGGNSIARKEGEYKIDKATGIVKPNTRGVSVWVDPAKVVDKGGVYTMDHLPEGLGLKPHGEPGHYEIITTRDMLPAELDAKLAEIKLSPVPSP